MQQQDKTTLQPRCRWCQRLPLDPSIVPLASAAANDPCLLVALADSPYCDPYFPQLHR